MGLIQSWIAARDWPRMWPRLLTVALWWAGFQQWGVFAAGWIALTPFLWSLHGLSMRQRFWSGYATGWLGYALINWWIAPTIARAGSIIGFPGLAGWALGILAVSLIALIHGSQAALLGLLWDGRGRLAGRSPLLLITAGAVLWAGFDMLRCETLIAHGWGALAYSQWRDYALLQWAGVIGQHGLTALCVWVSGAVALWLREAGTPAGARLWRLPAALLLALHTTGALWLYMPRQAADPLNVLLVQTNISSTRKSSDQDTDPGQSAFEQAASMSLAHLLPGGRRSGVTYDLIVWPETTAFLSRSSKGAYSRNRAHAPAIDRLCRETQTALLLGTHTAVAEASGKASLYNEAVLVAPHGGYSSSAKGRLVPFGERAPYGDLIPLLRRFAPAREVVPAPSISTFKLTRNGRRENEETVGSVICFESGFPYPARGLARQGARVLFVLTNDEWFSGTNAPWEHAVMSAIRAAENQVPVVQCSNGGYSFLIDRHGRFMIRSSFGEAVVVPVAVPLAAG